MYIKKASHYIPATKLDNELFSKTLDTSDEWIIKRTGIKSRYTASVESPERPIRSMAIKAVDKMGLSDSEKQKIKYIIFASGLAEENYPNVGNYIAQHLNIKVPGIRVNSACSSFVSGFKYAESLIGSGDVLVVSSEAFTSIGDYSDRSSCILFGDGACAFLLSSQSTEYFVYATELEGFGTDLINTGHPGEKPKKTISEYCLDNISMTKEERTKIEELGLANSYGNFRQDGPEVYKTIITDIPKLLGSKIKRYINDKEKIFFIGHQANLRMLEKITKKIGLTKEQHLYNVDRCGNTGAAGCGMVLAEEINKEKFKSGDYVVLSAFGAGIVYGSMIIKRI